MVSNDPSVPHHTTREQPTEAQITYPYHPRFGEIVQIIRRLESRGVAFVVILQPDGSFACLPEWMTEPSASYLTIGTQVHFSLDILRAMRAETDVLLGFLQSESKTETADNAAQIQNSSTKSIRRAAAAREPEPKPKGRIGKPRGSSAPRHRRDVGQPS